MKIDTLKLESSCAGLMETIEKISDKGGLIITNTHGEKPDEDK